MRRAAVAGVSILVAALMMCTPVSAKSYTVSFEDPETDIGPDASFNLPTDPNDQPTTSSPICQATYLDLVRGWVKVMNEDRYTLGFEVAGVLDENSALPPGATGVLWVWYFYDDTEYYADCMAVVSWDGEVFDAYFKYRPEMGAVPYPYWGLEFEPDGTTVQLTIGPENPEPLDLLQGMNAWFAETKVWFTTLIEPWEDWALTPNFGGWYPVDINDWDPEVSLLPWLPMP